MRLGGKQRPQKPLKAWTVVLSRIQKLQRRLWTREAGRRLQLLLCLCALLSGSAALLYRNATPWMTEALIVGLTAAIGAIGVLWVASCRPSVRETARLLDIFAAGQDRALTALELQSAATPSDWARHQVQQTAKWIQDIEPKPLLGLWSAPPLSLVVIAALSLIAGMMTPTQWLTNSKQKAYAIGLRCTALPEAPRLVAASTTLSIDELDLLRRDAELIRSIASQVNERETRKWLKRVQHLIEDVTEGRVDKRTALERISSLRNAKRSADSILSPQKAAMPPPATASKPPNTQTDKAIAKALSAAMTKALTIAPNGPARRALQQAAKRSDLGAMGRLLQKLAERAQNTMTDKQLERWIKVAEKYAGQINPKTLSKKFDGLRKRIERLQRKRAQQGGLSQSNVRRLRRSRRQLAQLQKKAGDLPAAKYQLQRLQRQAKRAVTQMRRNQRQASRLNQAPRNAAERELRRQRRAQNRRSIGQQLKRAAQQLRRQSAAQRARQAKRVARDRMQQLRQALARSGRSQQSRRDFERQARARRAQTGQRAKGPSSNNRRARAGRKGARTARGSKSGFKLGSTSSDRSSRMSMLRRAASRSAGSQAGGPDQSKGPVNPTKIARTESVAGVHGKGPTIKKVFTDAARHGFAKKGWRVVYADYSEVAEEMLDSESIPIGKESIVRRYFELIRPR
ncbi:MAG: hypothetical protein CMH53_00715 [Myxococcales bacterium]|nr:hypothetical protein [Myxococcales bacterium]